ncbi:hypothetical protein ACSBR2_027220 [Camellia fascicularis]
MGLCCCCCTIYYYVIAAAIITFFIASLPFNNSQPLSLSSSPSQTAKLSPSWINDPSIDTMYTKFDDLQLIPVLDGLSDDSAPQLVCGFCCPTQEIHALCLFGVVIFDSVDYSTINAPELVWSTNRDRPV